MKLRSLVFRVVIGLLASRTAWAVTGPDAAAASLAGEWVLTTTIFGSVAGERLKLSVDQGKITGSIYQRKDVPLTGTVEGDRIRFEVKDQDGSTSAYDGRMKDGLLSGTVTFSNEPWGATPPATWRARRAAVDKPAAPRTLDFEPKEFHRVFSSTIEPVLRIWPGDTVRTRTVDAGGVDEKAKSRSLGGNPQTGPFYVEGAMPGDVLVVHVRKLRLNRPTAISDDGFVDRALTTDYASEHKDNNFNDVVWSLDLEQGVARPAKPTEHLKDLAVPVRPMLGCVGVAPGFGGAAVRTGDSGRFGGNMDFNEIREGAAVYLPGRTAGRAALRRRRARAAGRRRAERQRARDVARRRVLRGPHPREIPRRPRVENTEYLMAMGLGGSLDEAFSEATSGLASWLESEYGLTGPEAAILLGATVEYKISEVADRNAGVVAKINRSFCPRSLEDTEGPSPPGRERGSGMCAGNRRPARISGPLRPCRSTR